MAQSLTELPCAGGDTPIKSCIFCPFSNENESVLDRKRARPVNIPLTANKTLCGCPASDFACLPLVENQDLRFNGLQFPVSSPETNKILNSRIFYQPCDHLIVHLCFFRCVFGPECLQKENLWLNQAMVCKHPPEKSIF